MSRVLLNPIPDWPALRVACVMLSVRKTADLCSTLFLQDCVAENPQDVVDTANSQTLSERGELRLPGPGRVGRVHAPLG